MKWTGKGIQLADVTSILITTFVVQYCRWKQEAIIVHVLIVYLPPLCHFYQFSTIYSVVFVLLTCNGYITKSNNVIIHLGLSMSTICP